MITSSNNLSVSSEQSTLVQCIGNQSSETPLLIEQENERLTSYPDCGATTCVAVPRLGLNLDSESAMTMENIHEPTNSIAQAWLCFLPA